MKMTLESLWNGNLAPGAACGAGDPEIENLVMRMGRLEEKLTSELGQPQRDIMEKYIASAEEYANGIALRAFCDGFALASKLMAEALH